MVVAYCDMSNFSAISWREHLSILGGGGARRVHPPGSAPEYWCLLLIVTSAICLLYRVNQTYLGRKARINCELVGSQPS